MSEKNSGKKESITINNIKGSLTNEEIKLMIAEGVKYTDLDNALKIKIQSL